jgi:hypothetical protein
MKFENNWKHKTLESLERKTWATLDKSEGSHLVKTCHALRKKQLKDFSVEDLRIMIGQSIGLEYLIPMAINVLTENILAAGDFYEGDLLKSVLTSDKSYWKNSTENWRTICDLIQKNEHLLNDFDTTWEIKKGWVDSLNEFKLYGQH